MSASATRSPETPATARRLRATQEASAASPLSRLGAMAASSPQVAQARRLRSLANGVGQGLVQRQTPERQDNPPDRFPAPNPTGLPDQLKSGLEALSGLSMDAVRVHRDSDKPAQLNAHAYAQGGDIHLAPGQEHHLPHEAWHLVQQAQGRVRPTLQLPGGVAVNDDPALEREADHMGARAAALRAH